MRGYYSANLSGHRLRLCYQLASPRVKQYLEAEVRYVLRRLRPTDTVLELGCGYGRVAVRLAPVAAQVVGIDTDEESLKLARALSGQNSGCEFLQMDAIELGFGAEVFDVVVCIQNGICAFNVDQDALLQEALRVIRRGGVALFSTYSDQFWRHRLQWFEAQADAGLIGSIDYAASRDGVIVCKDGFRAGRLTPGHFRVLCDRVGYRCEVTEVDESSVFCKILKEEAAQQHDSAVRPSVGR